MPGFYGEHTLAQFTTMSDFYWGTYLLVIAFALMVVVWVLDVRTCRRGAEPQGNSGI
jgi:hypothetical protein